MRVTASSKCRRSRVAYEICTIGVALRAQIIPTMHGIELSKGYIVPLPAAWCATGRGLWLIWCLVDVKARLALGGNARAPVGAGAERKKL